MKLVFCLQINTKVLYKLIVSLWACLARHAQSAKKKKQLYNILIISHGKCEGWTWSFACRLTSKVSSSCYYHFRCVCPGMLKLTPPKSLLFLFNILKKKWVMKLIFCMQVSMEVCYKLIVWGWSRIPKVSKIASLQCLSMSFSFTIINGHVQVFSNYSK